MSWKITIDQLMRVKPYTLPTKRGKVATDLCPDCKTNPKAISAKGTKQPYCLVCFAARTRKWRARNRVNLTTIIVA